MEENRPRGVPLSPKSMVDSVADWPLYRVVEYLKKKEQDSGDLGQVIRVHCRTSIKMLPDVIDEVASRFGLSRSRFSRWLSYHSAAVVSDDPVIARLSQAQERIRSACVFDDDTDTMDIMNSLIPYTPRILDSSPVHIVVYDARIANQFDKCSRVCGVYKYRILQIYLVKSIMMDEAGDKLGDTGTRLRSEIDRWDDWMAFRLGALEALLQKKSGG